MYIRSCPHQPFRPYRPSREWIFQRRYQAIFPKKLIVFFIYVLLTTWSVKKFEMMTVELEDLKRGALCNLTLLQMTFFSFSACCISLTRQHSTLSCAFIYCHGTNEAHLTIWDIWLIICVHDEWLKMAHYRYQTHFRTHIKLEVAISQEQTKLST